MNDLVSTTTATKVDYVILRLEQRKLKLMHQIGGLNLQSAKHHRRTT